MARARLALALGAVLLAGAPGLSPPAAAGYPEACFVGVEGAGRRLLLQTGGRTPTADAVLARAGARVGPRVQPLGVREVELPSPAARDVVLGQLAGLPGVRWAEPVSVVRAHRGANDPLYRRQWGHARMRVPRAWDAATGAGKSVTVAVLDTGIALAHPDLRGRVDRGPNVVDGNDDPSDDEGHGTHVAGIVAAATNNRVGVAGMSWGARTLAVKVLDDDGAGTSCDVLVGIVEAVRAGASVINMSLGGATACPLAYRAALAYAAQQDVVVIASAGNDALRGSPESAPANCPGVLGVGATDRGDRAGVFSTFGPDVDVTAPGVDVLSTSYDPKRRRHGYASMSGTSMAAPHVAGLAALLRARYPSWTAEQVVGRITSTVVDLGPPGRDDFYGLGRVDAAGALGR